MNITGNRRGVRGEEVSARVSPEQEAHRRYHNQAGAEVCDTCRPILDGTPQFTSVWMTGDNVCPTVRGQQFQGAADVADAEDGIRGG